MNRNPITINILRAATLRFIADGYRTRQALMKQLAPYFPGLANGKKDKQGRPPLAHALGRDVLPYLVKENLITHVGVWGEYITTEKGRAFMRVLGLL